MSERTHSGSFMTTFQTGIRDIPSPLRIGPFAKNDTAESAISGSMRPNVEVAMFIFLAIVIPVVAFFGIKWFVFRPTRPTIHPSGGAFMRVPRGRRRYVLFGSRLPPDPSRNCGRPRCQRTVVVIRDFETGLNGGTAAHSHADAATPTPRRPPSPSQPAAARTTITATTLPPNTTTPPPTSASSTSNAPAPPPAAAPPLVLLPRLIVRGALVCICTRQ